ncbi:hypothetical protein NC992_25855 [Leptolyngbya subtilissima DQ-A4]|uniref:Ribbon-helix-helix protein CopG domain-containing protein n=1 Tax=Leptolyngbya subtilissima DQ-A4 TaxID=2933933 RepID=A0ABV0KC42_9CYAN
MEKWDDIFSAAKPGDKPAQPPAAPKPAPATSRPENPWEGLEPPEKEATVRLNVDIPISLNDALADKARQLRKPKTELVRKLLEWALNDLIE